MPAGANPATDRVVGMDDLGRKIQKALMGATYTAGALPPKPARKSLFDMFQPPAASQGAGIDRQTTREYGGGFGGMGQGPVVGPISAIGKGLMDAIQMPGRAAAGQEPTLGDVLNTAGMVQLGGAGMAAPKGALRSGSVVDDAPGIRAYHGSPHSFDKFSMDKIGTGEGAQAYGHGLYFADSEGVARSYRDTLSGSTGNAQHTMLRKVTAGTTPDRVLPAMQRIYPGIMADDVARLTREMETAASPGSMYEVNIAANPDDFLDWDAPLSAQPQKVRDVLGEFGIDYDAKAAGEYDSALLDALYNDANKPLPKQPRDPTGGALYEDGRIAPGDYRNPKGAADALNSKGIAGIKYLDAGSRAAGNGSRNYVVFDENLISIVKKYGIAGAAAMLGVGAVDVEKAMADGAPGLMGKNRGQQ